MEVFAGSYVGEAAAGRLGDWLPTFGQIKGWGYGVGSIPSPGKSPFLMGKPSING